MFSLFTMGADSKKSKASTISDTWTNRLTAWSDVSISWSSCACIGVSTTPGEMVLNRIPSPTYSTAKARLNAGTVDLAMTGSEMGAWASG